MSHLTKILAKTAAIGGIIACLSGHYFKGRIEDNLKKSDYYSESLKILRSHKGIVHYMGLPIYEGSLNLGDNKNNYCTGTEAKFEVPIRGSKKKGTLYLFAFRESIYDNWKIQRLELGLEDEPDKRILVHDGASEVPASI